MELEFLSEWKRRGGGKRRESELLDKNDHSFLKV